MSRVAAEEGGLVIATGTKPQPAGHLDSTLSSPSDKGARSQRVQIPNY